jgi:hypothetical protein
MELMSLSADFVKQSHVTLLHSSTRSFIAVTTWPSVVHDGCQVLARFISRCTFMQGYL